MEATVSMLNEEADIQTLQVENGVKTTPFLGQPELMGVGPLPPPPEWPSGKCLRSLPCEGGSTALCS